MQAGWRKARASQGVLRAGDATEAVQAATRIRGIAPANEPLLAEEYLSGPELSIDGLLHDNDGWTPLAVFDKPATPGGPTFEETPWVTLWSWLPRTGADAA
jgi:hypothetical protein